MSRAENSAKNIITSGIYQVLLIALNFVVRLVFVKTLGEAYLGIDGLFFNILMVLSLADLGLESAILFKLYRPVEIGDREKITEWMRLFKRLYIIIGFIILALGLCIIPLLKYIIKDYEDITRLGMNPVLIFLLYVFQSASSYWFFSYKRTVVDAHQKTYLLSLRSYAVAGSSSVAQILVLLFWKDFLVDTFIMYTLTIIAFQILQEYVFARVADKYYPYINEKPRQSLSKTEWKELLRDCGGLFMFRTGNAVISATDNIALSALVNLTVVGQYSNYQLIYLNIRQMLTEVINSIGASIGSIGVTDNMEWKRNIFVTVNLATVLLFGCISVPLAVVGDEFIRLWLADENYVLDTLMVAGRELPISISYLIGVELYLYGILLFLEKFRSSFGLFTQIKFRPIAMALINLVLTVLLVPSMGASGAVISTIAAYSTTVAIFDPLVILHKSLEMPAKKYFLINMAYGAVTLLAGGCAWYLCHITPGQGILFFILHGCISVAVTGVIYLLFFGRTEAMRLLLTFVPDNRYIMAVCRVFRLPLPEEKD